MEDKKFDQLMSSIMESGAEEVPAGLWSAVESQLPAPAPVRAPVVIWFRRAGVALAAAAAVTLAVVFAGRQPAGSDVIDIVSSSETVLADVPATAEEIAPAQSEDAVFVPSAVTARPAETAAPVEASAESQTMIPSEAAAEPEVMVPADSSEPEAMVPAETAAPAEENTASRARKAEKSFVHKTADEGSWSDPFAQENAPVRRSAKVALTAFGNAGSNTGSTQGGAPGFLRTSSAAPSQTCVIPTGESRYSIPVSGGVGVKIMFTPHWSLGVGVNCSYLARTFDGNFKKFDEDGTQLFSGYFDNIRNNQVYIGIPLDVYYSIISSKHVDFYAYAGGSMEKCVFNKYTMGEETFKDKTGGLQFSVDAGIGVEFIVAEHLGIYLDPSVRYWFRSSAPESLRTAQPLMLGLELGLRFRL